MPDNDRTYVTYATDEEALANAEILFQTNAGGTGPVRLCVVKNPGGKTGDEIFAFFPESYDSMDAAVVGFGEKMRARRLARGGGEA